MANRWGNNGNSDRPYFLKLKDAAAANSLQSCPTLCDPIDGSPAGSPVPGFSEFDWQSFFLMVCKIMMCLNCDFLD